MEDKPKYDPQKHHRRSIRLKGYDYSQVGAYFITICIKDKECLFGKIADGEMLLNEAGLMIDKWWQKIPEKFPDIELGEYRIMPNHFHAIVINVGADPCVCPENKNLNDQLVHPRVCPENQNLKGQLADPHACPENKNLNDQLTVNNENAAFENAVEQLVFGLGAEGGEHMGSPLHMVVQWFKTMTTNDYIRNVKQNGWPAFNKKLWQRNYFEHIIRNDKSLRAIANYIYNNPVNWGMDKFFTS